MLAEHGGCDAWREPQQIVEFLSRCLLSAGYELVQDSQSVLGCFRNGVAEAWFERECELLIPSDAGAQENARRIMARLEAWGMQPEQRAALKAATIVIAVGSLGGIGRLPMQAFEPAAAN